VTVQAGGPLQATLVKLNPAVNAWFVLTLDDAGRRRSASYHLENASPRQQLQLNAAGAGSLDVTADGRTTALRDPVRRAGRRARAGAAIRPALRAAVRRPPVPAQTRCAAARTELEATSEFLRDHVWGGEQIVGFVRSEFFRDSHVERAKRRPPARRRAAPSAAAARVGAAGVGFRVPSCRACSASTWRCGKRRRAGPVVRRARRCRRLRQRGRAGSGRRHAGGPRGTAVAPRRGRGRRRLVYLVAFDLARLDLAFTARHRPPAPGLVGAHARRVAQPRPARARRHRHGGAAGAHRHDEPGDPGARRRRVPPVASSASTAPSARASWRSATAAATTASPSRGGLQHAGAGPGDAVRAERRHRRHEDLERGRRGAAGEAARCAAERRRRCSSRMRRARRPSARLVEQWGPGNWSGSALGQLRTLRAGACLLEQESRRYLVYGYFSTATPPTMARVFRAYGCATQCTST